MDQPTQSIIIHCVLVLMLLLLLSLSLFALVSYYFIVIQLFGCSAISVQQNSVSVSDHFAGGIHSQSLD